MQEQLRTSRRRERSLGGSAFEYSLPMESIRRQFPALERGVAYFDAPGGTQVPRVVADAMTDYLFHHNANTHWAYPTSEETDAILLAAREACADFLNCSAREVVFGN